METQESNHKIDLKSSLQPRDYRKKEAKVSKNKSPRASAAHLSPRMTDHRPHRHSFTSFGVNRESKGSSALPALERRSSSFACPSSPWARRRSFLSSSMIQDEKHLVYELHGGRGFVDSPAYSISLRESQGFTWNQDLFASQYQQQSAIIYDEENGDDDDDDALVMGDDEEEPDHFQMRRNGMRSFSYSVSNEYSSINKVEVLDFAVHSDDEAKE